MIFMQNSSFQSGLDFNIGRQTHERFRTCAKGRHSQRQACFFSAHGLSAHEHLSALCCQTSWRAQCQILIVLGPALSHDVCATDLARLLARYRSESAGKSQLAVPHGLSLLYDFLQHACQLVRHPNMGNLCRHRLIFEWHCQATVYQGALGHRSRCCRLRVRRQHYRLVSAPTSCGIFLIHQGRHQVPEPAGSAWIHPQLHSRHLRQDQRGHRAGLPSALSRSHVPDGMEIPELQPVVCHSSGPRLLCDPCQEQYPVLASLFHSSGPLQYLCLQRSDRRSHGLLLHQGIPGRFAQIGRQERSLQAQDDLTNNLALKGEFIADYTDNVGMWNCSSNRSSNTCASRRFGHQRERLEEANREPDHV